MTIGIGPMNITPPKLVDPLEESTEAIVTTTMPAMTMKKPKTRSTNRLCEVCGSDSARFAIPF